MSQDGLTDDEWRVKIAYDLGGVVELAPNRFELDGEDVTNHIISIILKRAVNQKVDVVKALDAAVANEKTRLTQSQTADVFNRMRMTQLPAVIPSEVYKVKLSAVTADKPKVTIRDMAGYMLSKVWKRWKSR